MVVGAREQELAQIRKTYRGIFSYMTRDQLVRDMQADYEEGRIDRLPDLDMSFDRLVYAAAELYADVSDAGSK